MKTLLLGAILAQSVLGISYVQANERPNALIVVKNEETGETKVYKAADLAEVKDQASAEAATQAYVKNENAVAIADQEHALDTTQADPAWCYWNNYNYYGGWGYYSYWNYNYQPYYTWYSRGYWYGFYW